MQRRQIRRLWLLMGLWLGFSTTTVYAASCPGVVIASHHNYKPLMWHEAGQIHGVGYALTTKLLEEQGIGYTSLVTPWLRVLDHARAGQIDVIVTAYKNAQRSTYLDFTEIYFYDPAVVFVPRGRAFAFQSWQDLKGKKGGMLRGTQFGTEFDSYTARELTVEYVNNMSQSFQKLIHGRNDYFIFGQSGGRLGLAQYGFEGVIEILPQTVVNNGLRIAIAKKSPCAAQLLDYFNHRIAELRQTHEIEHLLDDTISALSKSLILGPN